MNEKENKKKKELIVDIDRDIVVENNRGIEREITLRERRRERKRERKRERVKES